MPPQLSNIKTLLTSKKFSSEEITSLSRTRVFEFLYPGGTEDLPIRRVHHPDQILGSYEKRAHRPHITSWSDNRDLTGGKLTTQSEDAL